MRVTPLTASPVPGTWQPCSSGGLPGEGGEEDVGEGVGVLNDRQVGHLTGLLVAMFRRLDVRGQAVMGSNWYRFPMEAVVDQAGRIVLPKYIRDALGLLPGTKVDISPYGAGVQVVPAGRTARLVEENGVLVAAGDTAVDDDMLFGLIDAGRR